MDDRDLAHWAFAFVFAQLIELPIYMRGLHVSFIKAFGANAITHPIVWFVIPSIWSALYSRVGVSGGPFALSPAAQFIGYGVLAEGFAVIAETTYFRALGVKEPLRWAITANVVSALIGLISASLTGWP